jgi:hypothetical protein
MRIDLIDMSRFHTDTIAGRSARLASVMAGTWLLALFPAVSLYGTEGLVALSISAIVCLVPGCVVFWLVATASPASAPIRAVAWGSALRLLCALGGAYFMQQRLAMSPQNYAPWLGLCYMIALSVESWLVTPPWRQPRAG